MVAGDEGFDISNHVFTVGAHFGVIDLLSIKRHSPISILNVYIPSYYSQGESVFFSTLGMIILCLSHNRNANNKFMVIKVEINRGKSLHTINQS